MDRPINCAVIKFLLLLFYTANWNWSYCCQLEMDGGTRCLPNFTSWNKQGDVRYLYISIFMLISTLIVLMIEILNSIRKASPKKVNLMLWCSKASKVKYEDRFDIKSCPSPHRTWFSFPVLLLTKGLGLMAVSGFCKEFDCLWKVYFDTLFLLVLWGPISAFYRRPDDTAHSLLFHNAPKLA